MRNNAYKCMMGNWAETNLCQLLFIIIFFLRIFVFSSIFILSIVTSNHIFNFTCSELIVTVTNRKHLQKENSLSTYIIHLIPKAVSKKTVLIPCLKNYMQAIKQKRERNTSSVSLTHFSLTLRQKKIYYQHI